MITTDSHCPTHDSGGRGLPCPWPGCVNGSEEDTINGYRRATNVTDGRKWYTWKFVRPKGLCVPCVARLNNT